MRPFLFLFLAIFSQTLTKAQIVSNQSSAGITVVLPLINNGISYDYSARKTSGQNGYLGGGVSIFYKKDRNEFSLGYEHPGLKMELFPPKGGYSHFSADLFEISVQHLINNNIILLSGVNYTKYHFYSWSDLPPFPKVQENDRTIGLTVGAGVALSKAASILVSYRPALFSFDKKSYHQVLSLALQVHINFWKKR